MNMDTNETVSQILGMVRSLSSDFNTQADHFSQQMEAVERKIDSLLAAFPEGGLMAHRMYHEKQNIDDNERTKFRSSIRTSIAVQGCVATVLVVGYALWEYLKIKITRP